MASQAAKYRTTRFTTDEQRWRAVASRDPRGDGAFVYAVKTTGIYCRPTCGARLARRENIVFHDTPQDAERAGYRACKRCRPQRGRNEDAEGGGRRATIVRACETLESSAGTPSLAAVAREAGLSASHFHRVFKEAVGLTPKEYAAARRGERLRQELARGKSITGAAHAAGFGSAARFYAQAPELLGMAPSAWRNGGKGVRIQYGVGRCWLGSVLVGATEIGVCSITLGDDSASLLEALRRRFRNAILLPGDRAFEHVIARVVGFVERPVGKLDLPLDIRGTAFQQRVWRLLSEIPIGQTVSYSELAARAGLVQGARAVAGACAANELAVAIPCHRVVRSDGSVSGYRWGAERKRALLDREKEWR